MKNTAEIMVGGATNRAFDIDRVRADFPILAETVYGKPLVYLDSAASAQKPRQVIDAISRTYETEYANVHRGVHYMSQRATDAMEAAREKIRAFINAADIREIILSGARPRGSISLRQAGAEKISDRTTKSSFPRSSIIPTSFPGS